MSSGVTETTLTCARCGKPANLQCPKCVELKLPCDGAAFCTQDCFKASWSSHKSIHLKAKVSARESDTAGEQNSVAPNDWQYCLRKGQSRTPKLPSFDWTGTMKPYPISKPRLVPAHIDKPDWAIDGTPKEEPSSDLQRVVEIKTPEQIERMRETGRIAREVLDAAARVIRPGITTDEIDAVVHEATIAAGVHGDLNETFFVGNVDEASRQLVQCTYECLEKAIAIVKPGVRFREIGEIINRHALMSGFSVVKSYCGHGIGELFHCAPNIPHYASNWRDRMWPDGWTAVTADGKRSAQFEHTLLLQKFKQEVKEDLRDVRADFKEALKVEAEAREEMRKELNKAMAKLDAERREEMGKNIELLNSMKHTMIKLGFTKSISGN